MNIRQYNEFSRLKHLESASRMDALIAKVAIVLLAGLFILQFFGR